jgi:hypothetical protein
MMNDERIEKMAINKFLLLGLNATIIMILAIYLINPSDIRGHDTIILVYLFVASLIVIVVANEFIEKFKISNPVYFIVPGLLAMLASSIIKEPSYITSGSMDIIQFYDIIIKMLGWLLLAPGIVLLVRSMLGEKKKE